MANYFPIQTNFGAGVISPRLQARADAPFYGKGLDSCENWTVYPQGSLHRRGGTAYVLPSIATSDASGPIVRLLEMPSRNKFYVIELTSGKLRIFDQNGLVTIGSPQIIENNLFARGLAAWNNLQATAQPTLAAVDLVHTNDNTTGYVEQNLQRRSMLKPNTSYSMTFNLAGVSGSIEIIIGVMEFINNVAQPPTFVQNYLTPGAKTYTFTTPATVPADYRIQIVNNKKNSTTRVSQINLKATVVTPVTFLATPWTTRTQIEAIQTAYSSDTDETFFANQTDPVQHLIHPDILTEEFSFSAVSFTSPPTQWGTLNYPGSVEIYQGRLWLAGSTYEPNMVWASKTNLLSDFTLGLQDKADDALAFRIATKGGIQWLKAQRTLLTGTVLGEYSIQGSQNGPVTPQSIDIRQQSAFGSARVQPYNVADQVIFTSLDRLKVRAMSYELGTNGWNAADLTFLSPEITASQIRGFTFARDPLELIIANLADGSLAICTYHKASETVAWQKVSTYRGKFLSMAVAFYTRGSIWAAVQREMPDSIHGSTQVLIERISLDSATLFSDCGGTYPIEDNGEVLGLERLEGYLVDVVVDGAVMPQQEVFQGKVTGLDPNKVQAAIGIPYTATAVTLPLEGGNPGGSAQGVMKGRDRIFTRLFKSALPVINGYRAADDRTPATPMDTPEGLRTGDALLANLGVDRYARITIEQDLPAQTQISGVFGRSQVNSL
jgi:hypothetical protein